MIDFQEAKRPLGPNLKKFISLKMGQDAVPTGGGLDDVVKLLTKRGALSEAWRKAAKWCDEAIATVRSASEPNPWKKAGEEEIAGEILKQIDKRKP